MAVATATVTIFPYPKGFDNTQRNVIVRGTIAVSTGSYPGGGLPLSWGSLTNTSGQGIEAIPPNSSTPTSTGSIFPIDVDVKSVSYNTTAGGPGPSGFVYVWDSVNGNLHVFISNNGVSAVSGPLVELGGNIPGAVQNDTIQFTAVFSRNN